MINYLFKNGLQQVILEYVPWTQRMCKEIVHIEPRFLAIVPDRFKAEEMRNKAVG